MNYLTLYFENVPEFPKIEKLCKDCYRQFYVFLGNSDSWWCSFVHYLKNLSTRTKTPWPEYLAYLKTVDFLIYRQTLETELV